MKLALFTDPHYCDKEVTCRTRRPILSYGKIREAMDTFVREGVDFVLCLGDRAVGVLDNTLQVVAVLVELGGNDGAVRLVVDLGLAAVRMSNLYPVDIHHHIIVSNGECAVLSKLFLDEEVGVLIDVDPQDHLAVLCKQLGAIGVLGMLANDLAVLIVGGNDDRAVIQILMVSSSCHLQLHSMGTCCQGNGSHAAILGEFHGLAIHGCAQDAVAGVQLHNLQFFQNCAEQHRYRKYRPERRFFCPVQMRRIL